MSGVRLREVRDTNATDATAVRQVFRNTNNTGNTSEGNSDAYNHKQNNNLGSIMRVAERVAHALHSGGLRVVADKNGDADVIAAMGWVGRKNPLGAAMLRASVSGEQQETAVADAVALRYCQRMRDRWHLGKAEGFWLRFAATAVKLWRAPHCTQCDGLKFQPIAGTPTLSATACPHCKGTGMAQYPRLAGESLGRTPWRDRMSEVITYLETQQQDAENSMRKYLTGNAKTG
jgi:hypothetical protein